MRRLAAIDAPPTLRPSARINRERALKIRELVCAEYAVTVDEVLKAKNREPFATEARYVTMALIRGGLMSVGDFMNRNHSVVHDARRLVAGWANKHPSFAKKLAGLRKKVEALA